MKKIKIFLIFAVLISFSAKTSAQNGLSTAVSAESQVASARLIVPLTIEKAAGFELNFGTIMQVAPGAAVITLPPTVSADVTSSNTNNYVSVIVTGRISQVGRFNLTGELNQSFTVTTASAGGLINSAAAFAGDDTFDNSSTADQTAYTLANTMVVNKFTFESVTGLNSFSAVDTSLGGTFTSSVSGTGTPSFNVGADLNIGATQSLGVYTGTYTVTVEYD